MTAPDAEADPSGYILHLLAGKWISQAVSAAANLGISDALGESPLGIEALSARLDCDPGMLERLLLILVGEGLYEVSEDQRYQATSAGRMLASGAGYLKDLAAFSGSPAQWTPWAALPQSIRTGTSAFEATHRQSLYAWLESHPEDARLYDEAIDRFTAGVVRTLAARPELAVAQQVVDVGGGLGRLLSELLVRWPHLRGVLVERPHVLERATQGLRAFGVEDRCELVAGDFFGPIPEGGDIYVLKHVLHNWSDEDAVRILNNCRRAMGSGSRLWVVEGVLHPGEQRNLPRMMDLEMMVLFGQGRARSKQDFRRLARSAGLRMERTTHPLDPFARLLIAGPSRESEPSPTSTP